MASHHRRPPRARSREATQAGALLAMVVVLAGGCGRIERSAPDRGVASDFGARPDIGAVGVTLFTPVDLDDAALADRAVEALRGEDGCGACHGVTPSTVRAWGDATVAALACIGERDPNRPDDAGAILECFTSGDRADPEALGLLSAAVPEAWFARALQVAYPDDATAGAAFDALGRMPPAPRPPLGQDDVDVLLTWASRRMPGLEDRLAGDGRECDPSIGPEVAAHVRRMETEGWAVRNADRGLTMFGCAGAASEADCLTAYPTPDSRGWDWSTGDATLRVLATYDYRTSFWSRGSMSGRFVAHGGGRRSPGTILDLERDAEIRVQAAFDPSFLPDDGGFLFQSVTGNGGAGVCRQTLLFDEPTTIDFREPECDVLTTVGLYQQIGTTIGGDTWAAFGQYESDDGDEDLAAGFDDAATARLVPLIDEGNRFSTREEIVVATPFEGDAILSPSGGLLMSRLRGEGDSQSGFVLRALEATPSGDSFSVELPVIARYCFRGAKVTFSLDERWAAFHRYVTDADAVELGFDGPDDPDFQPYRRQQTANIVLLDLATGDTELVTRMPPAQRALFPFFRSDGWLYFVVRDESGDELVEHVVASDAAL